MIGVTATSAGITSLQSFGADATEPPILTIDGHARHAEKIDNFAPSEKVLALVDDRASTTVRVCSNERGSVTKANIVATSGIPGYDAEVLAETKRWKRAPYAPQGRPVAVCEIFKLITVVGVVGVGLEGGEVGGVVGSIGSPPPPPPPPPHPSPMNIPPGTLEQFRKTGERAIVPDDKTKLKLQTSGQSKLVGAFKLCVNSSGDVTRVSAIRSTGFPEYDTKLIDTMKTTWSYRPVIVDGKAKAVCTAITFIYSQL
ncbi:MAG: energy transducer TonB [Kofleriaceae bacterium]